MVKKEMDNGCLLKMNLEIKESELRTEEKQQKARHRQNNNIQRALSTAENAQSDITLLNHSFKIMQKDITEIKLIIKEGFKEVNNKFDNLPNHFATKEDHKINRIDIEKQSIDIDKLKEDNLKFKLMIAKWIGVASTISIIVGFVMNKYF